MVKLKKKNFGFENSSFDFDGLLGDLFKAILQGVCEQVAQDLRTSFQSEVHVYSIRDLCKGQEEPNITEYITLFG